MNIRELCIRLLLSGICFHSYQQVTKFSYTFLHLCLVPYVVRSKHGYQNKKNSMTKSIFVGFAGWAGFIFNTTRNFTGDPCSRKFFEASGGYSVFGYFLPNNSLTSKRPWYFFLIPFFTICLIHLGFLQFKGNCH